MTCALCAPDLAPLVGRSGRWRIVLNRNQNLLGKVMLVLDRHSEEVDDLTADEWAELRTLIVRVTGALRSALRCDHFNYVFLQNQDRHVHMHVVPRYASKRVVLGRTFVDSSWPDHYAVGEVTVLSEAKLEELAAIVEAQM